MRDSTKRKRTAIEAVAGRFSATWEEGDDTADAYLVAAGKRVAVEMRILKRRGSGQGSTDSPRLRFDKVAIRLMEHLKGSLGKTVPEGMTVLVTVTAPIRLPGKTAAALEDKIQTLLGQRAAGRDVKDTIHGNDVRLRLMRNTSEAAPKLIGFVHNPDSDPLLLLNLTGELLEVIGARGNGPAPAPPGERWLVAISDRGVSCLDAYRHIDSQLPMASGFQRILMVFGDGSVVPLKR